MRTTTASWSATDICRVESPVGTERFELRLGSNAARVSVEVSLPGRRAAIFADTGDVDLALFSRSDLAGSDAGIEGARSLVDHIVRRAASRFSSGIVIDTRSLPDGLRQVLLAAEFERRSSLPDGVLRRDLTLAEDGTSTRVLDNPALASLNSYHARFAERCGEVVRYHPDVSPWTGFPFNPTEQDWADATALLSAGAFLAVGHDVIVPDGWIELGGAGGVQLTGESVRGAPDPEAIELSAADVSDILDLVARTKPGPFLPRTIELGRYVGFRREGRLVALAGERLHPPGWTEISAVCTDPAYRGIGLAARLVRDVAHSIKERGEQPMLHAAADNTSAIRLYERLGFQHRRRVAARFVVVP